MQKKTFRVFENEVQRGKVLATITIESELIVGFKQEHTLIGAKLENEDIVVADLKWMPGFYREES